ncbi:MAG: hypothetical protein P1P84_24940 [Deferrisomatales bacterium]|nr:hypothetical protein [Deferrisomatales bacterium]
MTKDAARHHQVNFRMNNKTRAKLTERARVAGVSVSTMTHDLVVHGLDHPAGLGPELFRRIEDLHALVKEALAAYPQRDDLGARIDRVYAAVARTHKAMEQADQGAAVEQLRPWLVRAVVFLDGLSNLSLPDDDQYRQFHQKVDTTTRQILAKLKEEPDAKR